MAGAGSYHGQRGIRDGDFGGCSLSSGALDEYTVPAVPENASAPDADIFRYGESRHCADFAVYFSQ